MAGIKNKKTQLVPLFKSIVQQDKPFIEFIKYVTATCLAI